MGFSNIFVFIAGAMIFLHLHAITVVVSISSAIPPANLPDHIRTCRCEHDNICLFRQRYMLHTILKIPVKRINQTFISRQRLKRDRLIKFVAFCVISTCTSASSFFNALASDAILYAAILPDTPNRTVFPFSIEFSSFCPPLPIFTLYYRALNMKNQRLCIKLPSQGMLLLFLNFLLVKISFCRRSRIRNSSQYQ